MTSITIKNIAITAASGKVGSVIFKKLTDSGLFNVRVLSRKESSATFPPGTDVVKVDYDSIEELTEALRGQDALISAVGPDGHAGQRLVLDAAIAAGVKRFLPSEFGADLGNEKTRALPLFAIKRPFEDYVKQKATELGPETFTYTFVYNNAFLDWGIKVGFTLDLNKPKFYNGGNCPFTMTKLSTVGDAVVGVLRKPAETANRAVYIKDATSTQQRLYELAKEVAPDRAWAEPEQLDLEQVIKAAEDELARGVPPGISNMVPPLYRALYYEDYQTGRWGEDNELLGVKGNVTEDEIRDILRDILHK